MKIINSLKNRITPNLFCYLIALLLVPFYLTGREILIEQEPKGWFWESNITLNLILLYFLIGFWVDKYSKKKWAKKSEGWKGWVLLLVVLWIVTMFFKYVGGYETII